ncbi:P-loop NTPase [Kiloniella sp. EL199]|uniref:P-loop NTPase n=1 Tax=Kiloniella sp. EL199 TaxID=2107581 RepID=UPI000EA22D86|nr:P-loop NTPase [Kiloniella sp. EL199]
MASSDIDDIFGDQDTDLDTVPELVAFVSDGQTHDVALSVSKHLGYAAEVRDGQCQDAMSYLADTTSSPRYLLIDIGSDELSAATSIFSLVTALPENTKLIAVGTVNDIGFYREMIEIGVSDYLLKPLTEKTLLTALHNADKSNVVYITQEDELTTAQNNKTIVLGARGGVGASTVAVNLAWALAEETKIKTALLDMDIEYGTVALTLDVEPTRGLREALENPERLDSLFISSTTAKLSENLAIMATEENLTEDLSFSHDGIAILMEALSREYQQLIVDTPRSAVNLRKNILSEAGIVVLVTEYNLPCLRDTIRVQSAIKSANEDCEIVLLANRTGPHHSAVPKTEFEKALGVKIDLEIPEDVKLCIKAANNGKPALALEPKSKLSKTIVTLAQKISPQISTQSKTAPWRKLIGLK